MACRGDHNVTPFIKRKGNQKSKITHKHSASLSTKYKRLNTVHEDRTTHPNLDLLGINE